MKNYLSLDLELNNNKIIQVGIAIGSKKENIVTYKWYVNPNEPITEFITNLTGITQKDIDEKSVSIDFIASEIKNLIIKHEIFPNPVQWGHGDSKWLKELFENHQIDFPYFGNREIDVKTIFSFIQVSRNKKSRSGLLNSMKKFGLEFKGEPHRADVDAYNTLAFYLYLIQRQSELENYKIK